MVGTGSRDGVGRDVDLDLDLDLDGELGDGDEHGWLTERKRRDE